MTEIAPGVSVTARTADDQFIKVRAITSIINGLDFAVVWVCSDDEWSEATTVGRDPIGIPWPADDVRITEDASVTA